MPNHCSIEGCTTVYHATQDHSSEDDGSLSLPVLKARVAVEMDQVYQQERVNSIKLICEKHFHEDALSRRK